jgi:ribonuclease BN (tRNA processing enzyme)
VLLTVLGSGTAIPVPDRFPAGYLLRTGTQAVLIDLGPGTLRRLPQARLGLEDLDAVFLTHFHTDHCADLAALLFALRSPRYAGRRPLQLFAAPGLLRLLRAFAEVWPWTLPRDYELRVTELLPGAFALGDLEIRALPIRHTAQSLGYRFTGAGGKSVAFSGDADECDELVELARSADLFVCDAAFPDQQRVEGHLTPGLAGQHAQRAGARTLLLTHFYPECDGVDVVAQARACFGGEVLAATDLLVLRPGAEGAAT